MDRSKTLLINLAIFLNFIEKIFINNNNDPFESFSSRIKINKQSNVVIVRVFH